VGLKVKLITRDTDYAIRALCHIAEHKKKIVSVKELTAKLKIPRPFLRKILQILNKNKVLISYKGKGGGFKLNVSSNKILLTELIKIFQGPFKLSNHVFKNKRCPNVDKCKLKKKLDAIEKYVNNKLKDITISCLLMGE